MHIVYKDFPKKQDYVLLKFCCDLLATESANCCPLVVIEITAKIYCKDNASC